MSCSEFANPEDSADDWALFQQLRSGLIDRYSLEKRYIRKDRTQLWGRLNVSILKEDEGPAIVFAFVEEITERKNAEQALRESEERFRLAAQAGKMFAYEWDVATDAVVRSEEHLNVLGFSDQPKQLTRQQLAARIHPDDRDVFLGSADQVTPGNPIVHISYRLLRPDGSVVWLEKSARAFFDQHGKLQRMIGMVADVTQHKQTEEALSNMSRRLIDAQEQERVRIARELHDDLGQRVALLANELQDLQRTFPDLSNEVSDRIRELRQHTFQIATDIQSLSHELHSSKLEYLGIAAAMRSFCNEFGGQQKVNIDFQSHDVPASLSPAISICLFRVLQEALRNSLKHSGAREVEVRLWGMSNEIHLAVSDSGAGFDRAAAKESRGLGLISMEERLKLVQGTFLIETQPRRGTRIHAHVPIRSESDSMRAAG